MSKKVFQIIILVTLAFASFAGVGKVEAWSGCGSTYVVQWGDSLSAIAANCGTTMSALWQANPGLGSWVYAGQVLQMPGGYTGSTGGAYATYVVARGDTLKIIATRYGVNVDALASLNGIYNYNLIFVGQVLSIPNGGSYNPAPQPQYGSTYVIQYGDTLRKLAYRWGTSIYNIQAANPQITNASLIYVGQVINMPGASSAPAPVYNPTYYTVQAGDTLRIIANRYGTSVYNLQLLNPQIWNPNYIYWGMVLRVQ